MKCVSLTIAVGAILTCGPALAIPPPWTLEETKAQADLVLIARMTKVEPVQNVQRANSRIAFEPLEVLKGQLDQKKPEDSKVFLLFSRPQDRPAPGGIQAVVIGGTGEPKPADGQTALLFLKKDPQEPGAYRTVCGSFGYLGLSAAAGEDRSGLAKRIAMHREWCAKIGDPEVRKAMEAYYDRATRLLDEQETPKEK